MAVQMMWPCLCPESARDRVTPSGSRNSLSTVLRNEMVGLCVTTKRVSGEYLFCVGGRRGRRRGSHPSAFPVCLCERA